MMFQGFNLVNAAHGATLYNAFARYDDDFALASLLVIVLIVLAAEAVTVGLILVLVLGVVVVSEAVSALSRKRVR